MNIAIFTSREHCFTYEMLRELLPLLSREHAVRGVFFFPEILIRDRGARIYNTYLKIFGPAVFMQLALQSLAKKISLGSFAALCARNTVQHIDADNPNDPAVIEWLRNNGIDIVLNFVGYILRQDVLAAPAMGVLNKHAGLLPAYKGVLPVFWTLLNNDEVGVTIHEMDIAIDGGRIIRQEGFGSSPDLTVFEYYRKIFRATPKLVAESLQLLAGGKTRKYAHAMPPSYFGLPARKDYRAFKKKGLRFV